MHCTACENVSFGYKPERVKDQQSFVVGFTHEGVNFYMCNGGFWTHDKTHPHIKRWANSYACGQYVNGYNDAPDNNLKLWSMSI